jgi:ABC-type glycerol-3-phosphate transport system substrate-binding protein
MSKISRRELLKGMGALLLATPLMQACQPKQEPEAGQPAATATTKAEPPTPVPEEPIDMSVAVWVSADRPWPDEKSKEWDEMHPEVNLKRNFVEYADSQQHQLTGHATGTLEDVVFGGVKFNHYAAYKGVFLDLGPLVEKQDCDFDDFIPAAIEGSTLDGMLFAFPYETNTGNENIYYVNKDILAENGVEMPTDDWTWDEFVEKCVACTDVDNRIFGTNQYIGTYYDLACYARSLGGDIFDAERKNFTLLSDQAAYDAAKWCTELRTVHHCAPLRDEAEDLSFWAGQIAFMAWGTYGVITARENIGDNFEWDIVLAPKGPDGLRGYEIFVTQYMIYSGTKYPEKAYDLLCYLHSKETAMYAFVEQGQSPARVSVMNSPEAAEMHSIWARVGDWMADGINRGPFPMPWNLRFAELHDVYNNNSQPMWYGETPFEEAVEILNDECQKIMALPRG